MLWSEPLNHFSNTIWLTEVCICHWNNLQRNFKYRNCISICSELWNCSQWNVNYDQCSHFLCSASLFNIHQYQDIFLPMTNAYYNVWNMIFLKIFIRQKSKKKFFYRNNFDFCAYLSQTSLDYFLTLFIEQHLTDSNCKTFLGSLQYSAQNISTSLSLIW